MHYIYDLDGHLIAEADSATGATTREYLWLPSNDNQNDTLAESTLPQLAGGGARRAEGGAPDLPLAIAEGTALYQVHTDHLGRPVRMTDAARATVWQASWKPWGEIENISGTILNNLRFPGQYFQIETGLAYNHHRHYDAVTGRYTQPDPLGFVDGPSVYAYAMNSPFMNTDRLGLDYIPPGRNGHGALTITGGNHGGVIIDLPGSKDGKGIPAGQPIPPDADVDFVCINGQWWKLKGGYGGANVEIDYAKKVIRRSRSTSMYPASRQPRGWNAYDYLNRLLYGPLQSPSEYSDRIAKQDNCQCQ